METKIVICIENVRHHRGNLKGSEYEREDEGRLGHIMKDMYSKTKGLYFLLRKRW